MSTLFSFGMPGGPEIILILLMFLCPVAGITGLVLLILKLSKKPLEPKQSDVLRGENEEGDHKKSADPGRS